MERYSLEIQCAYSDLRSGCAAHLRGSYANYRKDKEENKGYEPRKSE